MSAIVSDADNSVTKRDFIYVATGAMVVVGVGAFAWPFIDSMNPSASIRSLATVEIPLGGIEVGQRVTVMWRGRPVFVDRRTEAQIDAAVADDENDLVTTTR